MNHDPRIAPRVADAQPQNRPKTDPRRHALRPVPRGAGGDGRTEAMVALFGALAHQGSKRGPKSTRHNRNPYRRRRWPYKRSGQ
jgi:hypothetical protein